MSASNSADSAERLYALHTITTLPLDPRFPLFEHYPAMKIGVRESVRYYASLLAPLAAEIIAAEPETMEWVVTAPPLYAIPAGANLLAWEVYRILTERMLAGRSPSHLSIREVNIRYALPIPSMTRHVLPGDDYSSSGVDHRIRNRQAVHEGEGAPKLDAADFRGRAVLYVNDINVTGTQQFYMQRALDALHPASIHWLYVIQVDPALGRSNPEVEYSLNYLNLDSFEDFAEIVANADIEYTSRCVARLFAYPQSQLEPLFRSLEARRRKRLHQLASAEGAYTGEGNEAKLALLRE